MRGALRSTLGMWITRALLSVGSVFGIAYQYGASFWLAPTPAGVLIFACVFTAYTFSLLIIFGMLQITKWISYAILIPPILWILGRTAIGYMMSASDGTLVPPLVLGAQALIHVLFVAPFVAAAYITWGQSLKSEP